VKQRLPQKPFTQLKEKFDMATLPVTNPTLLDLANRMDPNGKIPAIVEILNETNEILDDMAWKEGNLPPGHKTKIRTGIPEPTWRKLYQGVMPTRSTTAEVTDTTGMMEAYSEIDVVEADLNGNTSEFRLSEDRPHLEGFNQSLADALFYASELTTPAKFTGLAPRYNDLSAENAENIIDAGGTGTDNASMWLVVWGDQTCHGIVPKGIPAGLRHDDKGQMTVSTYDSSGAYTGKMEAYVTHYQQHAGLTLKDWRFVVRICNIDKSLLIKTAATGADIVDLLTQAVEIPPNLTMGRAAIYVPKQVRSMMRRQIVNKVAASTLTMETVGGKKVVMFDGIPVRTCAALSADEARVV
jgi:glutathione S-transferase